MAARPYLSFTIDLLAAEFVAARDGRDEGRLTLLRDELARRSSKRAQALASHGRVALAKVAARPEESGRGGRHGRGRRSGRPPRR